MLRRLLAFPSNNIENRLMNRSSIRRGLMTKLSGTFLKGVNSRISFYDCLPKYKALYYYKLFQTRNFGTSVVASQRSEVNYDPQYDIVIVDIETTGLSPNADRIIEIGASRLVNGVLVASFNSLVNPGDSIDISPEVKELTGISNTMCKLSPPTEYVLNQFVKFVGNSVVVAHNTKFDLSFLKEEMTRYSIVGPPSISTSLNLEFISNQVSSQSLSSSSLNSSSFLTNSMQTLSSSPFPNSLCTLKLCRRLIQDTANGYNLKNIIKHLCEETSSTFPFENFKWHRAMADTQATIWLWRQLYRRVVNLLGFTPPLHFFFKLNSINPKEVQQFMKSHAANK